MPRYAQAWCYKPMGTRHVQQESSVALHAAQMEAQQAKAHQVRLAALLTLDCLRGIPENELERLADISVFRAFAAGTTIISEHKLGDFLYLVLQGTVRVVLHDRNGREILLGVLNRGDCCGEGPLFGDYFRQIGVYAEQSCNLLQLSLAELRELLPYTPQLNKALRRIYRQRLSNTTIGRVPLFNHLSQIDRVNVGKLLRPAFYDRGAAIVMQGTPGNALYVIETGQVVIERDGQLIAHLKEGDYFGEMSLLDNKPHNATVRALTPITVLELPAHELKTLLQHDPDLATHLREVATARRSSPINDKERAQRYSSAIQHGLLRGTHLFVRTPELCPPGCHLCETACGTRFGRPRIHLNGTALDELDILDTCRQCRVGAECVQACPEDALTWDERGALFVNDRCTGCGKCVEACPYDAVQLVPTAGERHGPMWQLWETMRRARESFIHLEPTHSAQHANKCDLCHGYDDMACLSVCPTGSLRLVPVEELFPL